MSFRNPRWLRLPALALLMAVLLLASATSLAQLARKPFWMDEVTSVTLAQLPAASFWQAISTREANSSFYYVLLRYWVRLGEEEFTIRLLSVVFAVISVALTFWIGRRLFDLRTAWIAAALLSLNTWHVHFAQEARGYSLAEMLVALTTLLFVSAIERPALGKWMLYTLASALSVYAHFYAGLVLITQWMSLALLPRTAVPWRHVIRSIGLVGALIAPLGYFILTRDAGQVSWLDSPTLRDFHFALFQMAGAETVMTGLYTVFCLLGIVAGFRQWQHTHRSPETWRHGIVSLWFYGTIALAMALSFYKPIFVGRYLMVSLPAMALLAASAIARLARPIWHYAGATLLCTIAFLGVSQRLTICPESGAAAKRN